MLVVLLPAALPSLVVRTASPVAPFCARSPAPAPRASGCVLAERPRRREAIFLAGLPGSGKTRVIKQRFGFTRDDASVLDLDKEIVHHPNYDPESMAAVYDVPGAYEWADERVERAFRAALADPDAFPRIVLDGTGTKVKRRLDRMAAAREAGLWVKLLYVRVKLKTALRRNGKRRRQVPLETLQLYQRLVDAAVAAEKGVADEVEVLDNDTDRAFTGVPSLRPNPNKRP